MLITTKGNGVSFRCEVCRHGDGKWCIHRNITCRNLGNRSTVITPSIKVVTHTAYLCRCRQGIGQGIDGEGSSAGEVLNILLITTKGNGIGFLGKTRYQRKRERGIYRDIACSNLSNSVSVIAPSAKVVTCPLYLFHCRQSIRQVFNGESSLGGKVLDILLCFTKGNGISFRCEVCRHGDGKWSIYRNITCSNLSNSSTVIAPSIKVITHTAYLCRCRQGIGQAVDGEGSSAGEVLDILLITTKGNGVSLLRKARCQRKRERGIYRNMAGSNLSNCTSVITPSGKVITHTAYLCRCRQSIRQCIDGESSSAGEVLDILLCFTKGDGISFLRKAGYQLNGQRSVYRNITCRNLSNSISV